MAQRREKTDKATVERSGVRQRPAGGDGPRPDDSPPEPLDPAHAVIVDRGLEEGRAGAFASEADVEAAFRRFGA